MRTVVQLLCCVLFFSGIVWAQATAQIAGTVRDTSGAVIPGVEIKVTQTAIGASRTAVSNEEGRYVFANLPLGPYMLEANQPDDFHGSPAGQSYRRGRPPIIERLCFSCDS